MTYRPCLRRRALALVVGLVSAGSGLVVGVGPARAVEDPESFLFVPSGRTTLPEDVKVDNDDVVAFDASTGTYDVVFDGEDHDVPGDNALDGLAVLEDGRFVFSFTIPGDFAGFDFDDSDLLAFDPASGEWSLFFDASDIGLSRSGDSEDVDAVEILGGDLYLSMRGDWSVPDASGKDEDVLVCEAFTAGEDADCEELRRAFDGSDVGLTKSDEEDIDGIGFTDEGVFFSTAGGFKLPDASGAKEDMFGCEGTLDDCEEDPDFERVFDGDDYDLDVDLHDFTFGEVDGGGGETPTGADLSVTKIALPVVIDDVADLDSPPPGRDGLFRFTVTNEGPEATTASVVDELPPGLVLADDGVIIIGYPCSTDGNTTSCIFELQPGESVSYDIFYDAEQAGTFTNTVTVSGDAFDPDLSNNTASADAVVVAADLAAAVVGPSEIDPSAPFDVTFRLTNNGPATPEGQHLIVTLPYEPQTVPAGCTLVPEPPSSMRTYLCLPAADLASGESAEFTFTTGIGFFGNYEAEADASNLFDPDVTNNQAESYITYP